MKSYCAQVIIYVTIIFVRFEVRTLGKDHGKTLLYYLDFERINVTYYNRQYYGYLNVSAQRYGRRDPIHYMHFHGETLVPFGDNVTVNVYIYEFLSNEYRRSFVEMHYKLCDFFLKDTVIMPYIKAVFPKICPLPVGSYHFVNLSFPDLPLLRSFPFQKGRVFIQTRTASDRILDGYFDMEIKHRWR